MNKTRLGSVSGDVQSCELTVLFMLRETILKLASSNNNK